ncbi:MAG: hypothetical protein ABH878_04395, partial [bacterium]
MMRKRFGADLFVIIGLAIFLLMGMNSVWGSPQVELSGPTPLRNGDSVLLQGSGFLPNEVLTNFGVLAHFEDQGSLIYRGFDLSNLTVTTNSAGEFRREIPLDMLSGIRGRIILSLYYEGRALLSDYLTVHDTGEYRQHELDSGVGTLIFDNVPDYIHGGDGEYPVVNGDNVPIGSNASGGWSGDIFLVNLERYTTDNATGTSSAYSLSSYSITFSSGDIVDGSTVGITGLSITYQSIRLSVVVWDAPNYGTIIGATTTGTTREVNWLSTKDEQSPNVLSAYANDLPSIVVTFDEAVTTPSNNSEAIDNWTVTFNGTKAVSALSPLGSSGTTTVTLTVADLGDRGATPTVAFTRNTAEFKDATGNSCLSTTPYVTAADSIVPATPTLTSPTTTDDLSGGTLTWAASPGSGTDNSLARMVLQGCVSVWDSLTQDTSSPYGGTWTITTQYNWYRVKAVDTNGNIASSAASVDFQNAHHLDLDAPAAGTVNTETGAFTVTVRDNYGNPESVTQTIGLSTTSSGGTFRAVSGGPSVGSINITTSYGNFYYIDTQVGTPWINVSNVTLRADSLQYTINQDTGIASIKIRTASGGGGSEWGTAEIAGSANGGTYNVTDWMYVAGYNVSSVYISDVTANWTLTGTLTGSFDNADPASSNRFTASALANESGTIVATHTGAGGSDATGTITVDATKPATVTGFNVTGDEDQDYVNASWTRTSSYDDGSSAASGNVYDFDVRFASTVINSETAWNNATSVSDLGQPSSFNGSSSWRIWRANSPVGYYYYAIKTMDPQGNWSNVGTGCYTSSPDYSLPVTLADFTAKGGYGKIILNWTTRSEVDALGFQILRDTNPDFTSSLCIASYETEPELVCRGSSAIGADYSYQDSDELLPESTFYYRLEFVDVNGNCELSNFTASAETLPLPGDYTLGPGFPNPFNNSTRFELLLPQEGVISVIIYDTQGREVARVLDGVFFEAGVYSQVWNGTGQNQQPL